MFCIQKLNTSQMNKQKIHKTNKIYIKVLAKKRSLALTFFKVSYIESYLIFS